MMKADRGSGSLKPRGRVPDKLWLLFSFLAAMVLWYILSILPATSRCFPNVVETFKQVPVMIKRGVLWRDLSSSMISVFAGFGLGFVIIVLVARKKC